MEMTAEHFAKLNKDFENLRKEFRECERASAVLGHMSNSKFWGDLERNARDNHIAFNQRYSEFVWERVPVQ